MYGLNVALPAPYHEHDPVNPVFCRYAAFIELATICDARSAVMSTNAHDGTLGQTLSLLEPPLPAPPMLAGGVVFVIHDRKTDPSVVLDPVQYI